MPITLQRKNKILKFRITSQQYNILKNITEAKGFATLSDYLRFIALEKNLLFDRKIDEIYNAVMKLSVKDSKEVKKKTNNEDSIR